MVYVFRMVNDNLYKIGRSTYPENRFNEISVLCPYDMVIENKYKVNHPTMVEKRLHTHFKEHNIKGEWYRLNDEQVQSIPTLIESFDYHRGVYVETVSTRLPINTKVLLKKIHTLYESYRVGKNYLRTNKKNGDTRQIVSNMLGISGGMITMLLYIERTNPSMLEDIDKGLISVSSVYKNLKGTKGPR